MDRKSRGFLDSLAFVIVSIKNKLGSLVQKKKRFKQVPYLNPFRPSEWPKLEKTEENLLLANSRLLETLPQVLRYNVVLA